MFDINFIDKPGIKNEKNITQRVDDSPVPEKKQSDLNDNVNINNKKFNVVGFLISFAFILFVIFSYKVFDYNVKDNIKYLSVNSALKIISEYDEAQIQSISANKKEIRFTINISQSLFYDFLNLFREINLNVKGSNNGQICKVYIDENWYIEDNNDLLNIRNCIKDFKGIESELLKDSNNPKFEKLIVVSDFNNLVSLLGILEKRSLIHSHAFKINKSNNNSNYYEIIFYD